MPECNHYTRSLYCSIGDECLYLHIDPTSKIDPCPHYEKGFCPLGPRCSKRHVRRKLCKFYLAGFCPQGRSCKEGVHARWPADEDLPKPTVKVERSQEEIEKERQKIRDEGEKEDKRDWERKEGNKREGGRGGRGGRGGGGRFNQRSRPGGMGGVSGGPGHG